MSKVYLWERPKEYSEEEIGIYDQDHSLDYFLFQRGKYLSNKQIDVKPVIKFDLTMQQTKRFDCLLNTSSVPIINNRLADLLREYAAFDIQLFDVKIECIDGELEGYKIMNVCHAVKGIDHAQSVYKKSSVGNYLTRVKRLIYKAGCLGNHKLARDEEYKGNLLVSDFLHNILSKHNFTGLWLAEPEKYYQ